jgi:hypothetical protein
MLDRRLVALFGRNVIANFFPKKDERLDAIEEDRADHVMKDVALKGLRKGIIEVIRTKKK